MTINSDERYVANSTLSRMFLSLEGRDQNQPGYDWSKGWNDALRQAMDYAQPAPNAVAYLDLGTGGYMDIGTEFTDEELATLPKGRHMLGIVGTYGVDGYVPAQPAPSMPDVDSLAQFIREVDGSHQLGAGVLAERIAEWLKAAKEAKP